MNALNGRRDDPEIPPESPPEFPAPSPQPEIPPSGPDESPVAPPIEQPDVDLPLPAPFERRAFSIQLVSGNLQS